MIDIANIEGFFIVVIGLCTLIVLVGNTIKTFKDWLAPHKTLEERIEALEEYGRNDNARIKNLEDSDKLQLKAISVVLDHYINPNNGQSKMQAMKEEISEFLINK